MSIEQIGHFLTNYPLLFLAILWTAGGLAFAHFESKAGIE